jgi:hypothetical protein
MSQDTDTLNRATNRDPAHTLQRIEGYHQILLPSDAQDNDGVFLQSGKPVPATIGDCAGRPKTGGDAKIQYAVNGRFICLNTREVPFRSQSNDAPTRWAPVPANFQGVGKPGETNQDIPVSPNRGVAATTR